MLLGFPANSKDISGLAGDSRQGSTNHMRKISNLILSSLIKLLGRMFRQQLPYHGFFVVLHKLYLGVHIFHTVLSN